jgi:hypothetical protein
MIYLIHHHTKHLQSSIFNERVRDTKHLQSSMRELEIRYYYYYYDGS